MRKMSRAVNMRIEGGGMLKVASSRANGFFLPFPPHDFNVDMPEKNDSCTL